MSGEVCISVELSVGMSLGLEVDPGMRVSCVEETSVLKDVVAVGSLITKLNDQPATLEALSLATGSFTVHVLREEQGPYKHLIICLEPQPEQEPGLSIRECEKEVIVAGLESSTVAEEYLKLGDRIVHVQARPVQDKETCIELINEALLTTGKVYMLIEREQTTPSATQLQEAPDNRMLDIEKKQGFGYHLVWLNWRKRGPRLGLVLKDWEKCVFVASVEQNSLSSAALRVGDRLLDVDAQPVDTKDQAKTLLLNALKTTGATSFLIERPSTDETRKKVQVMLTSERELRPPPSIDMPSDIDTIVTVERQRLRQAEPNEPKQSCIRKPNAPNEQKRITMAPVVTNVEIRSDVHPDKPLKRP